ncbi:hypothetical protein HCN44_008704 [Aphidius gifuensis]|uniref:AAA-ATPase-like domain-containing protein n=1 Tax=Aphidius gifuensis TaxID=684658 RepID=A0A834XMX7_APHGI|nr:hypothetical protein HCN44_008704 [Aphidius gifuensis]
MDKIKAGQPSSTTTDVDAANLSKYDKSTSANQDEAKSSKESKFIQELEKLNNNKPITPFIKHILKENGIDDVSTLAKLYWKELIAELVEKDTKENPEDYKYICRNNRFSIENKILLKRLTIKSGEKLKEEREIAEGSKTNPIYKKNFNAMLNGNIKKKIESGYYVDKTKYFQNLIERGGCYLITRPRCFGKTTMLKTTAEICEGEDSKKLFKNTAIGKSPTYQWKKYPVFEFDFSMLSNLGDSAEVENSLIWQMIRNCEQYYIKVDRSSWTIQTVFKSMMEGVAELKNGYESKVVILIDEYDEPLYDSSSWNNENEITKIMQEFYFCITSYLKSKIQMVLITGAAKLYMTKIFNNSVDNFVNISLDENVNAICGYTHSELITVFEDKLDEKCRKNNVTKDELLADLNRQYGGYKFSKLSKETIYNPWYIGRYLKSNFLGGTWESKNPNHFVNVAFMDIDFMLLALKDPSFIADNIDLSQYNYDDKYDQLSLKSFLFQTGLLTIDNYNKKTQKYTLKIPNITAKKLIETRTKYYGFFSDLKEKRDILLEISKDRDVKVFIDCLQSNLYKWPYNNKQCEPTAYHMYLCDVIQEIYQLTHELMTDKIKDACEPTREDVIATTFKCMYMSQLNYILEKIK